MSEKIELSDITVVVQGAVDQYTSKCLLKIRRSFPGAKILLSTWEGTPVSHLDFDNVIFNKDPGGTKDLNTAFVNNLNRQLVSTLNGLKSVKTKYALKVRSNLIFRNNNLLKYFDKFQMTNEKYKVFDRKVIFCSYFFKRYLGEFKYVVHPTPYHISDWMAFGLTKDLIKLFDVPLTKEPEYTNFLINNKKSDIKLNMFGASHQYAPEQYIFYNCVKKYSKFDGVAKFESIIDYSDESIKDSENFVVNNCIILDPSQISCYCAKNGIDPYREWSYKIWGLPHYVYEGLYSHFMYLSEYKRLIDKSFTIPFSQYILNFMYLNFRKTITKFYGIKNEH